MVRGIRSFYPASSHAGYRDGLVEYTPIESEQFYGMGPSGRTVTRAIAGDQRTTASEFYAMGYELWSAGPDGAVDAERTGAANRDNVSPTDYWRDLK